jgi:hypothetical protein
MRQSILVAIGLVLGTGVAAAQTHHGINEISVKETMVFATDVKVGATLIRAGEYRIECNGDTMKFYLLVAAKDAEFVANMTPVERSITVGNGKKVLEVPCKGRALSEPRATTEAMLLEKNGVFTLDVLYLRGSNVEHVF